MKARGSEIRQQVLRGIHLSRALASVALRRRSWGPFLETFEKTRFDHAFSVSFAQGGEDLALLALEAGRGVGTYLDIGAHHPSRFSVTRLLYQRGWSGVNVDANPYLIERFHRERTRDTSIAAFVGVGGGERDFYIFEESALSTGMPSNKKKYLDEGNFLDSSITLPVTSLKDIMEKYFTDVAPDVLNVDCEGADEEVLASGDWSNFRPPVVVVETEGGAANVEASGPVRFLIARGYSIHWILPMATLLLDEQS